MKKFKSLIAILIAVVLATGLVGCSKSAEKQPAAQNVNLTVSAAASLTDAMNEIKTLYAQEKPGVNITYNFGASGSLEQQIEQGADVDIFLSAATKQMDQLKDKGLTLEDTRKNFLGNSLVLVVPQDSTAITSFKDLTNANVKKIALGEPKSVPAGQYGEESLTKLNLLDTLKKADKIVYAKDVKEVLTWVESGNADAGIVYATDAKTSTKVKVAATADPSTYTPVVYPGAVLKNSKNVDAAKDFINFLYSDKAKAVFEKYGFVFMPK